MSTELTISICQINRLLSGTSARSLGSSIYSSWFNEILSPNSPVWTFIETYNKFVASEQSRADSMELDVRGPVEELFEIYIQ